MMLPLVHSNDGFTQLEEVWLGDVYPHEFYDHLDPDVRDVFYRITDLTREDLDEIQRKLIEFGVQVRRPIYSDIENHVDHRGQLTKPEITPRDNYLALGTRLILPDYARRRHGDSCFPWDHVLGDYAQDTACSIVYHDLPIYISGANTVRLGRDLYVDCVFTRSKHDSDLRKVFDQTVVPFFPDHRCHYLDNGGHVDACFAVLRPGQVIANRYFTDYDQTFPGWNILLRDRPEFQIGQHPRMGPWHNGKWWLPDGLGNRSFNEHVIQHAQDWIGDYRETFFEINCLVVNPEHVFMLGENPGLFEHLKTLGITAHSLPFRCRTFWDGGLHCLTVDIRRQGGMQDYFADRY